MENEPEQENASAREDKTEQENAPAQENKPEQVSVDLEFAGSGDGEVVTRSFAIPEISGVLDLTAVFLPGTDFDFRAIRFMKN